jgi:hypothetical protein
MQNHVRAVTLELCLQNKIFMYDMVPYHTVQHCFMVCPHLLIDIVVAKHIISCMDEDVHLCVLQYFLHLTSHKTQLLRYGTPPNIIFLLFSIES